MGFFDDLEEQVGDIPGPEADKAPSAGDYGPVLDKLRQGWVHTMRRAEPIGRDSAAAQFQEAELRFDGERYLWTTRLVEKRGRTDTSVLREDVRHLDEQGLLDAFGEFPWVGTAALDAAGVDRTRPDF